MIEKGSTATEFEEYKSQTYEINLGKNLFNPSYEVETQYTISGIASDTQYVLNDNVISCDKSNNTYCARFFNILEL